MDATRKWRRKDDDSASDEQEVGKIPELTELFVTELDWVTKYPVDDDRFRQTLHLMSDENKGIGKHDAANRQVLNGLGPENPARGRSTSSRGRPRERDQTRTSHVFVL